MHLALFGITNGDSSARLNSTLVVGLIASFSIVASAHALDCNGNGRPDACDISCSASGCAGTPQCGSSSDCNSNGVPDECAATAPFTSVMLNASVTSPIYCTAPAGDSRLWIVQQDGRIRIFQNGAVLATDYLNLSSLIATGGEQGLLGMAFDPQFFSNARFYVYYVNTSGNLVIARYRATGNNPLANTANPTATVLKTISHPTNTNHNGGCLQFGRDGFLYAGIGDGGGGNDPNGNAQNGNTLLGKMLRLDVNNPPNYIPASNPFVSTAPRDEIWALGYRNPWRFSVDRLTGNIFVGDVGQSAHEEIDFEPFGAGGRNYGWRCMEGNACTGLSGCTCNSAALTNPILDIPQSNGSCSVIGGYVYRGCAIPGLQGTYFYSDLCGNYIKSFRYSPTAGITQHVDRTAQLDPSQGAIDTIVSFGEDGFGELYYCSLTSGGSVYKIVPTNPICGNHVVEGDEECDDGNTTNGDGCSANCDIETTPTGACCAASGSCSITTSSACSAGGGTYRGNGTNCNPNLCTQPTGACCAASGSCSITTSSACSAAGGTYRGNGTNCNPNLCTQPTGACCAASGSCSITTSSACTAGGGTYRGNGTNCNPNLCTQPTGACCAASGSCTVTTSSACTSGGGAYQGNGTSCTPNQCPQPTGACCAASGSCGVTTSSSCNSSGGTYQGNGSDCSPNPCSPATGACCAANGSCSVTTSASCTSAGGDFVGAGTTCSGVDCDAPTCADVRRLKGACMSNGNFLAQVVMDNHDHDGQTVTVAVNGAEYEVTIVDRIANGFICCPHGVVTLELVEPADCVPPITFNCP